MSRLTLICALIGSVALLAAGSPASVAARPGPAPVAASTPQHAAGVVVDTGSEVRRVCVRFSEDTISGEELLRRAQMDPVFSRQAQGTGVCALCGVGCPASDCFCESETTGRYWNYSTSSGSGWQRSNHGVHRRTIRHGDMDGWAWGGGGAVPPAASFESVCPPPASPEPSPAATPSPRPTPSATRSPARAGSAPSGPASPGPARTTPTPAGEESTRDGGESREEVAARDVDEPEQTEAVEPTAEPATEAPETPSAEPAPEPTDEPTAEAVISVGTASGGGAGVLRSVAWFTAALAVIGGAVAWRRRKLVG